MIKSARKVVQVGLTPIRCGECAGLLCTASTGSVLSIICGRCKTHNIIEVQKPVDLQQTSQHTRP